MAKQPTSNANVADERDSPAEAQADWLSGYQASDPKAANTDTTPGWQNYGGPGDMTVPYKAFWKTKPRCFPNGPGDEGSA
jgi:hypothetical protein